MIAANFCFFFFTVNLLSNAIKYTPSGGTITLTAWQASGILHMVVQDTGVGMDADTLASLFRRFQQVGSSSMGGSGLGLSITKRLIEAMNGEIIYSSAKDQGTIARMSIPAEVLPPETLQAGGRLASLQQRRLAHSLHVLIAEDNDVNRRILGRFLEDLGCTHESATNGAEAVEIFRQHQAKFDACMLDLRMPVLDGIEATRQIRELCLQQHRYADLFSLSLLSLLVVTFVLTLQVATIAHCRRHW